MFRKLYLSLFLFCGSLASGSLYAETVRIDFSALVTDTSGYEEYFPDGQVTGYLTYDTDIMWSGTDSGSASYSFDSSSFSDYPFAQFYISELDQSFQLDYGNLYGGSNINLGAAEHQTYPDEVPYFSVILDIGTSSMDPLFLNGSGQLPTQFNQDAIDAGDIFGYLGVSPEDGSPGSLWSLNFNAITVSNVVAVAPIELNSQNYLVLGGNGLATASHLDASFGDLTTSRTTIGYENHAVGEFTQSSNTHLTNQLSVGGDSSAEEIGFGTYRLEGGILQTQETIIGDFGEGVFIQYGGTHSTQRMVLGYEGYDDGTNGLVATGVGSYRLSDGLLQTEISRIGVSGRGSFSQAGGTHRITGNDSGGASLIIGNGSSTYGNTFTDSSAESSLGHYNLSGGDLIVTGLSIIGGAGTTNLYGHSTGGLGYFQQSGGRFETDRLQVGENSSMRSGEGHYQLDGGLLVVNDSLEVGAADGYVSGSSFAQTAGLVDVGESIMVRGGRDEIDGYRILGGVTSAKSVLVGSEIAGLATAKLEVLGDGILEVQQGISVYTDGALSLDGGSVIGDVTIHGGELVLNKSSDQSSIEGFLLGRGQSKVVLNYHNEAEQTLLSTTSGLWLDADTVVEIMLGFLPTEEIVIEDFFAGSSNVFLNFDAENVYFTFVSGLMVEDGATFNYSLNGVSYEFTYSAVPLPAATWLFLSGIAVIRLSRKSLLQRSSYQNNSNV